MSKSKRANTKFTDSFIADKSYLSPSQLDAIVEREAFSRLKKGIGEPIESNPKPARVQAWRVKKASPKKQG